MFFPDRTYLSCVPNLVLQCPHLTLLLERNTFSPMFAEQ